MYVPQKIFFLSFLIKRLDCAGRHRSEPRMEGAEYWWWVYTIFPLILCLILVHYCCRYIFSIAWFSVKLLLALTVYLHIQCIINSYIGTSSNVFCIESELFGIPPGSISVAGTLGFKILKSRTRRIVTEVCPMCFAQPAVPPSGSLYSALIDGTYLVVQKGSEWLSSGMGYNSYDFGVK